MSRPPRLSRATRPIRLRRMGTAEVRIREIGPSRSLGSGAVRALSGFAVALLIGVLLLGTPLAAEDGEPTNLVDALFTGVSAICVTGLTVFDTSTHWSMFGEIVIITLVQLGGLGYMVGTGVLLWAAGRQMGLRDRQLLRLYYSAPSLGETLAFVRNIAIYALALEAIGTVILFFAFLGEDYGVGEAGWQAGFHSISAFNNSGFNITGNDMIDFRANHTITGTISVLVVLGGMGAIPVLAFVGCRSWGKLPLDAKIIFLMTGVILVLGTVVFAVFEWDDDETIGRENVEVRVLDSFFEVAMSRTAGFSVIPLDETRDQTKMLVAPLMFVGGAAGSTAGGIKIGTFALLLAAMLATVRGEPDAVLFRRKIPERMIRQALAITIWGLLVTLAFILLMMALTDEVFVNVMFDSVSALGTVGMSTGVPGRADAMARLAFTGAMLLGRFGPLVLLLQMNAPRRRSTFRVPGDSIRLG